MHIHLFLMQPLFDAQTIKQNSVAAMEDDASTAHLLTLVDLPETAGTVSAFSSTAVVLNLGCTSDHMQSFKALMLSALLTNSIRITLEVKPGVQYFFKALLVTPLCSPI